MKLSIIPFQLRFKYPFRIAHGVRETTDVVYVKLEHDGYEGWGEATLPPYLSETQQSVTDFLSNIDLNSIGYPFHPAEVAKSIDEQYPGNMSAKAAFDIALWNLKANIEKKSIGALLGIPAQNFPLCTYTIGICSAVDMKIKINDAHSQGFELFKIKLNGQQDEEMISNFKYLCDKPFAVDVNQGWGSTEEAIRKINWLKQLGCILVEQPLSRFAMKEMEVVKNNSALPVYADESCQRLDDIEKLKNGFHGINIKLMKCGGISEAYKMLDKASELGLKVLVGCISESSVGCTAAAYLTPLADYADLDGPYLISNDSFTGMKVENGRVTISPLEKKEGAVFLPSV